MPSNEESVDTKLQRIAKRAREDKHCQFTSLFHLMNKSLLLECFASLRGKAAPGIDNISREEYAQNLDANLDDQLERLHNMSYRPQAVKRVKEDTAGGVISPLLANIYLHYVLDLWFERRVKRERHGYARLIRYADDCVACFQESGDAESFEVAMIKRLNEFSLDVAPEKTKRFEFGKFAYSKAKFRGERAATFDFLGFTHYGSRSRDRKRFRMKRKTISKRFTAKLVA